MPDSVYAAFFRQTIDTEASILFLRRSNGQWWLPGGAIMPDDESPAQAIRNRVTELLSPLYDWCPGRIGIWRLSPEAGGHEVHLFEGYVEKPDKVKIRDQNSGLSQELAFFYIGDIHHHLYTEGDMPWGQAKMAIYCLYDLHRQGRRAEGELLREDLGNLRGTTWNRPSA